MISDTRQSWRSLVQSSKIFWNCGKILETEGTADVVAKAAACANVDWSTTGANNPTHSSWVSGSWINWVYIASYSPYVKPISTGTYIENTKTLLSGPGNAVGAFPLSQLKKSGTIRKVVSNSIEHGNLWTYHVLGQISLGDNTQLEQMLLARNQAKSFHKWDGVQIWSFSHNKQGPSMNYEEYLVGPWEAENSEVVCTLINCGYMCDW